MTEATALAKRGIVAGLLAGLVAVAFHVLWTEPLIDRAVMLEREHAPSHGSGHEPPVVTRETQKGGLALGLLLYGMVWGIFLGLFAAMARRWIPLPRGTGQGVLLAAMLGWAVAGFPFLKYPANPPGVVVQASIGDRQETYLLSVGFSLLGLFLALWLYREGRQSRGWSYSGVLAILAYTTYLGVLYWLLPAHPHPVARSLSEPLVWQFRTFSFAGLLIFWGSLGTAFEWLCRRAASNTLR